MPAAVVGGQVKVDEMVREILLAPTPVNSEVFHQKAGHHHAQTVVHVARLVDLRHGCVNQRVAGAALAPGSEQGLGVFAVFKLDLVVFGLERLVHHMRVVGQDLVVKVAPDQLRQPGACTQHALNVHGVGNRSHLADRDGPEPEVHAEVAGTLDRWKIPRFMVAVNALGKIFEQLVCALCAGGYLELAQVGGFKAHRFQAGCRRIPRRLQCSE